MLAYYRSLAPILFDEHNPLMRDAQRTSPVAKAKPSPAAGHKAATEPFDPAPGQPHGFRTLLADLATLTRNRVQFGPERRETMIATPTELRRTALNMLGATKLA